MEDESSAWDSQPSGMGTMAVFAQTWIAEDQSRFLMQPPFIETTFRVCWRC